MVEFGSWDGVHLSNTYYFEKSQNYTRVLIESSRTRLKKSKKHLNKNNFFICKSVDLEKNAIDKILDEAGISSNIDVMSIDIDGMDYWVFESLNRRPKVVVIEFNPSIPLELEFIQPKNSRYNQGASAKSISLLAEQKKFSLVAATKCNLIFVADEFFGYMKLTSNCLLEEFFDFKIPKIYAFSLYDGTIMFSEPIKLLWHDLYFKETKLPFFLRKIPTRYSRFEWVIFDIFRFLKKKNRD